MPRPKVFPEPHHEPIGFSEEGYPVSRRWIVPAVMIGVTLAAAILVAIRP